MIISWFTQPKTSNASYYQYDTLTRTLVRVRLERGRAEASGAEPQVIVSEDRVIGFSKEKFSSDLHATVSDNAFFGQFSAKNGVMYVADVQKNGSSVELASPADGKPSVDQNVYDVTADEYGNYVYEPKLNNGVHFGNPVATKLTLPEGVTPETLSLIANDAMLTGRGYAFKTNNDLGAKALSEAIEAKINEILLKNSTSDAQEALQKQIKEMKEAILSSGTKSTKNRIDAFDQIASDINKKIIDGDMIPDGNIEKQFSEIKEDISRVKSLVADSSNSQALQTALDAVEATANKFNDYVESVSAENTTQIEDQISQAQEAVSQAKSVLEACKSEMKPYEALADTSTVEDYMSEIGVGSDIEYVPELWEA